MESLLGNYSPVNRLSQTDTQASLKYSWKEIFSLNLYIGLDHVNHFTILYNPTVYYIKTSSSESTVSVKLCVIFMAQPYPRSAPVFQMLHGRWLSIMRCKELIRGQNRGTCGKARAGRHWASVGAIGCNFLAKWQGDILRQGWREGCLGGKLGERGELFRSRKVWGQQKRLPSHPLPLPVPETPTQVYSNQHQ